MNNIVNILKKYKDLLSKLMIINKLKNITIQYEIESKNYKTNDIKSFIDILNYYNNDLNIIIIKLKGNRILQQININYYNLELCGCDNDKLIHSLKNHNKKFFPYRNINFNMDYITNINNFEYILNDFIYN